MDVTLHFHDLGVILEVDVREALVPPELVTDHAHALDQKAWRDPLCSSQFKNNYFAEM